MMKCHDKNCGPGLTPNPALPPTQGSGSGLSIESSCDDPLSVEVCGNDSDNPLYVELPADQLGIETALAPLGCILDSEDNQIGKVFVYKTADEATGAETVRQAAYFTDGTVQDPYTGPWEVCEDTEVQVDCVEAQNLHYGIENGAPIEYASTIRITFDDGNTIDIEQPAIPRTPPWFFDEQNAVWRDQINEQAEQLNYSLVATARFVDHRDPDRLVSFDTPFGPVLETPSIYIARQLAANGMVFRYLNLEICKGEPVPVRTQLIATDDPRITDLPRDILTAGPFEDKRRRFYVCRSCGDEPIWYDSDGVTEVSEGRRPLCYEPCGVLAQLPLPGSPVAQFFFDSGCDDTNSSDPQNFVPEIYRRTAFVDGQEPQVYFYRRMDPDPADPDDMGSLDPYELVGNFVDCPTGEGIETVNPPTVSGATSFGTESSDTLPLSADVPNPGDSGDWTKEVVIINDSDIWLLVTTFIGYQSVPPRGVIEMELPAETEESFNEIRAEALNSSDVFDGRVAVNYRYLRT